MLTKEDAAKWADALESGRYLQWRGALFDAIGPAREDQRLTACCLMVLHDIKGSMPVSHELMSDFVANLLEPHQAFFVKVNDVLRYDFHQIAQIVRQRYQVVES